MGVNPYLVCRYKAVWGANVDESRLERWLENEEGAETEEFAARLRKMKDADSSLERARGFVLLSLGVE